MGSCVKCGQEAQLVCAGKDRHPICSKCVVTLQSQNGKPICQVCGEPVNTK